MSKEKAKIQFVTFVGNSHKKIYLDKLKDTAKNLNLNARIIGDGIEFLDNLPLHYLEDQTNFETFFGTIAHYFLIDGIYPGIDRIKTRNFAKKVQNYVDHPIVFSLSSCHAAKALEEGPMPYIFFFIVSGKRHRTLVYQSVDLDCKQMKWKSLGLSNFQILFMTIQTHPETLNFLPAVDPKDPGKKILPIKFQRPGRFYRTEVMDILDKTLPKSDASYSEAMMEIAMKLKSITKKPSGVLKEYMSLGRIKKALGVFNSDIYDEKQQESDLETDPIINCLNLFIKALRTELQNKLTAKNIKKYLSERSKAFEKFLEEEKKELKEKEEKKEGQQKSYSLQDAQEDIDEMSILENFYFIAINRKYDEEVLAITRNNPEIIHITSLDRWTPLMVAAKSRNSNLVSKLIKLGARVNQVNMDNETALDIAISKHCPIEIIQILIAAGAEASIDILYKDLEHNPSLKRIHKIIDQELKTREDKKSSDPIAILKNQGIRREVADFHLRELLSEIRDKKSEIQGLSTNFSLYNTDNSGTNYSLTKFLVLQGIKNNKDDYSILIFSKNKRQSFTVIIDHKNKTIYSMDPEGIEIDGNIKSNLKELFDYQIISTKSIQQQDDFSCELHNIENITNFLLNKIEIDSKGKIKNKSEKLFDTNSQIAKYPDIEKRYKIYEESKINNRKNKSDLENIIESVKKDEVFINNLNPKTRKELEQILNELIWESGKKGQRKKEDQYQINADQIAIDCSLKEALSQISDNVLAFYLKTLINYNILNLNPIDPDLFKEALISLNNKEKEQKEKMTTSISQEDAEVQIRKKIDKFKVKKESKRLVSQIALIDEMYNVELADKIADIIMKSQIPIFPSSTHQQRIRKAQENLEQYKKDSFQKIADKILESKFLNQSEIKSLSDFELIMVQKFIEYSKSNSAQNEIELQQFTTELLQSLTTNKNEAVFKLVCKKAGEIQSNKTVMQIICELTKVDNVEYLMLALQNINQNLDQQSLTNIFHAAIKNDSVNIFDFIFQKMDINRLKDDKKGRYDLMKIIIENGSSKVLKSMFDQLSAKSKKLLNDFANSTNDIGYSVIEIAINSQNILIMELLLKNKINLNPYDSDYNMIACAAKMGNSEILKMIINYAKQNDQSDLLSHPGEGGNQPPLKFAIQSGNIQNTELLLKNGAVFEKSNQSYRNYLKFAIESQNPEMMELVITQIEKNSQERKAEKKDAAKIDWNDLIKKSDGVKSIFEIATAMGNEKITDILLKLINPEQRPESPEGEKVGEKKENKGKTSI